MDDVMGSVDSSTTNCTGSVRSHQDVTQTQFSGRNFLSEVRWQGCNLRVTKDYESEAMCLYELEEMMPT